MLFILVISGSVFIVDSFFDLQIDIQIILMIAVWTVVYSIFLDKILYNILKYLLGQSVKMYIIHNGFRYVLMLSIGAIVSLHIVTNLITATALTLLMIFVDLYDHSYQKSDKGTR